MAIQPMGTCSGSTGSSDVDRAGSSPSSASVRVRVGGGQYDVEQQDVEPEHRGCCPWFRRLVQAIRNFFSSCFGRHRHGDRHEHGSERRPSDVIPAPAVVEAEEEYDPAVEHMPATRPIRHRPHINRAFAGSIPERVAMPEGQQ